VLWSVSIARSALTNPSDAKRRNPATSILKAALLFHLLIVVDFSCIAGLDEAPD
jgi:hypothetical protein